MDVNNCEPQKNRGISKFSQKLTQMPVCGSLRGSANTRQEKRRFEQGRPTLFSPAIAEKLLKSTFQQKLNSEICSGEREVTNCGEKK
jgi:hypothetical protein